MNPYLCRQNPDFVIIDYRASQKITDYFTDKGILIVKTIQCNELQEPVSGHPDMVMQFIDEKNVVIAPNVYDYYNDILKYKGIKVIKGGKTLSRNYPDDIAYNVARIGQYAIHNTKYTDEVVKYYLQKQGVEFIHVNQGYAKCSVSAVDENKAVTSDRGIEQKLKEHGINCLYTEPYEVVLKGYNHGFIGGAIGAFDSSSFLVTGKIGDEFILSKLKEFIQQSGFDYIEISGEAITDLGTIIPVVQF